jgi:hypothetical protein
MDAVPDPSTNEAGKYGEMFEQIGQLKPGSALRVEFATNSMALYARSRLRKLAKEQRMMLSSSKENHGATRYFWLEKVK